MTNPTNFTYSFSSPPPREPAEALFAVDKLSEFHLGEDRILARNPRTGRELVLPGEYLDTLVRFCSVFSSLDEHVAELMKGSDGDPARAEAIRQVVKTFRDGGLTISAAEICRALSPSTVASPIAHLPVVVIITCDRPAALERLLGSIVANSDPGGIERLFVVDDSRSSENAKNNRDLTIAAGESAPAPFHYFGAAEAAGMLSELIGQLPQHEQAIRFLCDRLLWNNHKSYGLARNYSHLLSIGKPVVVFDDDALCEAYDPPFQTTGVAFDPGQRETEFYASHQDWQQGLTRHGADPIAAHLQCLGLTLPAALAVLGFDQLAEATLRGTPLEFARCLGPGSRVLVTECGSLGDPGTGNVRWLTDLPPASRERLASNPGAIGLALTQRRCWLGRPQPTFHPSATISQVTGFDNRQLLPPYFPVTRGEDRMFGRVTRFLHPDCVALDYPWAAPHLPLDERGWNDAQRSFSVTAEVIGMLVSDVVLDGESCLAQDPMERLRLLAARFGDLGSAADEAVRELVARDRHRYRAEQMRKLQSRIEESAGMPQEWRTFLEDALEEVQSSWLGDFELEGLQSSEIDLTGPALLQFWRQGWRSYGLALSAWPEIREAARDIVDKTYCT